MAQNLGDKPDHIKDEAGSGESSDEHRPDKPVNWIWKLINWIAAVLTIVVLSSAILLPSSMAYNSPSARLWSAISVFFLFCALLAIFKLKVSHCLPLLFLACVFFFVSCSSNFHWGGG
jgi:hypothetical protein